MKEEKRDVKQKWCEFNPNNADRNINIVDVIDIFEFWKIPFQLTQQNQEKMN